MRLTISVFAGVLVSCLLLAAMPVRGAYPAFPQATVKCKRTSAQSISNNTTTTILFGAGTEFWKSGVTHSTSTNTGRLVVVTPGKYDVIGFVEFAASATSDRRITVGHYNSSDVLQLNAYNYIGAFATLTTDLTCHQVFNAVANDYFTLDVAQFSGGALNANTGTSLSATWIGVP